MTPNPRKRSADSQWTVYDRSKLRRTIENPVPLSLPVPKVKDQHALRNPVRSTPVRPNDWGSNASPSTGSRPFPGMPHIQHSIPQHPVAYKPAVRHGPHPDSRLCQDFHWIPYPLGLMPYDSWQMLHNRSRAGTPSLLSCPVCRKSRNMTVHRRKLFLVAERLSWEDGIVSIHDKHLNQELTWEVNYELGILDPCAEDPEQVPGGKQSQSNRWHPYKNQYEMKQAFNLIFMSNDITVASWSLWIGMQMEIAKIFSGEEDGHKPGIPDARTGSPSRAKTPEEIEGIDLTLSPDRILRKVSAAPPVGILTPPSSMPKVLDKDKRHLGVSVSSPHVHAVTKNSAIASPEPAPYLDKDRRIESYKTLPDFYSLLDQIERTSLVGALFLEAYAENTQVDKCSDCWLKAHVTPEDDD